ncbi:MAG: glycosyltransferase family 4 protein [Clostridia bacterium]|nr:glycosyltransferase family 4 protein [Clostridia bacterium]
MKKIEKVLFVISNISFGGAQRVTWTLAEQMKSQGIEPVVVAVGHSTNNYTLPEGIKVVQLGQKRSYEVLRTIARMKKVVKGENPSVVITMGVATCLFSVPAVLGTGISHIISERNDPRNFLGKTWVKNASRRMVKKGSGFVFQTEEARDFYPEEVSLRGCVIPNPIMAKNLPECDRENEESTVVTMGRLTAQKNHPLLIDAFAELIKEYPQYKLHIYGSGELKAATSAYITEKNMTESVILFDACDDVLQRIKRASIFVLSSDFEGMPNALMEAMAMGLACVSTDCPCGGPHYLIQDGENGLLVPVADKDALAKAMLRLAESKELREKLGNNSRELRNKLSADAICARWVDYCTEVVNGK